MIKDEWVFTHNPVILGHLPAIASALFLTILVSTARHARQTVAVSNCRQYQLRSC